ncbi:sirohydrochlorin cobaltochelatase [Clostridium tyrobutyricum]|uniref:sirohydrochlorin cobaltochelatase n=1 Tax=Clostridium tyrobutyricum TaxID=1519 RepID=UPI0002DA130B|nr:sirohydrochlorin cobaltochelatase [Clostridium tyrobutyricum]MBV4437498.1 sirohydrochlorin cobaltochelatase [Clostridium tyrobutyricum]MEA5009977.1 sirohydrochlorin cobaltochelatase [Clostridium tyrobutyricum]
MSKKGILVVSFGTSILNILKSCIESTENSIKNAFKDYEIRRAFTSNMIISKLKRESNIYIDTVDEALSKMEEEKFDELYIQPLHIIPGDEYDKILRYSQKYNHKFKKLVVGRPILYREEDYRIAAEALKKQLPENYQGKAVILMGHGSSHPINASYSMMENILADAGVKNIFIATVEGYPILENVVLKLRKQHIKDIMLMPFMLVAGNHVVEDMSGDNENSWENRLKKLGFKVELYLHGLGENTAFHQIYINHIRDSINGNPLMEQSSPIELCALDKVEEKIK